MVKNSIISLFLSLIVIIAQPIFANVDPAKGASAQEAFNPDDLDAALEQNPDALKQEAVELTTMQRYFSDPLTKFSARTYALLPEKVQLALLACYLYMEEKYYAVADYMEDEWPTRKKEIIAMVRSLPEATKSRLIAYTHYMRAMMSKKNSETSDKNSAQDGEPTAKSEAQSNKS
ncbi:MAG: hypothetical protein WD068_02005 [Candidatus Babeliales bacterium]